MDIILTQPQQNHINTVTAGPDNQSRKFDQQISRKARHLMSEARHSFEARQSSEARNSSVAIDGHVALKNSSLVWLFKNWLGQTNFPFFPIFIHRHFMKRRIHLVWVLGAYEDLPCIRCHYEKNYGQNKE